MPRHRRGRAERRSIGYAVVGLGHIAQTAVLPAFAHAKENSRLVALVSGESVKRKALGARYGVPAFRYEDLDDVLTREDVDALYIALPNTLHEECAIRAARAGVHVLTEKPMATSEEACRRMIDAAEDADVKLMVAYRLHFERANIEAIEVVRAGRIGKPRFFTSEFSYQVKPGNIRTEATVGGGALWDLGPYCVNAARYLFGGEPIEVMAMEAEGARPALPAECRRAGRSCCASRTTGSPRSPAASARPRPTPTASSARRVTFGSTRRTSTWEVSSGISPWTRRRR